MTNRSSTRIVPYSADQMFDLVADVERYPEFIPWCMALRVASRRRDEPIEYVTADMVVAFRVFREKFRSLVRLDRPQHVIDTEYVDGPFRSLRNKWRFVDRPPEEGGGCHVHFDISFEFRNFILQATAQSVFDKAFSRMTDAFVTRAETVYSPPAEAEPAAPDAATPRPLPGNGWPT